MRLFAVVLLLAGSTALADPIHRDRGGTLLIGDSMMRVGVGPVLRRAVEEGYGPPVDLKAKGSTGLARPDFYDWPKAARELLSRRSYRSVVMFIGANDCQGISESGRQHKFASPSWNEIYAKRVTALADQLCAQGRKVYWMTLPPMRAEGFNRRIKQLNALTRKTLATRPCVKVLDTDDVLTDKGRFATYVKDGRKKVKIREGDGIHLTAGAGELLSRLVLEAMSR